MQSASELFESAISWLQANYARFRFFLERDVVWTIQTYLIRRIEEASLPYRVFSEYPIMPGNRRGICVDLAIIDSDLRVQVAAELKYEPSHLRTDILPGKFPLTTWAEIEKDVARIQQFVGLGKTPAAYSVFIDEGNFYRQRVPPAGSTWISWKLTNANTSGAVVLWSQVELKPVPNDGLA